MGGVLVGRVLVAVLVGGVLVAVLVGGVPVGGVFNKGMLV